MSSDQSREHRDASEAYDKIDRFLRNNLDDTDYAEYSAALEVASGYAEGWQDGSSETVAALSHHPAPVGAEPEPVAEIIECPTMGGQTVREIDGRWKFLPIGAKLYALKDAAYVRGYQDGLAAGNNLHFANRVSAGEPIHVEAVATVRANDECPMLDWLIEGGMSALQDGQVLVIADRQITDDDGSGEVYLASSDHSDGEKEPKKAKLDDPIEVILQAMADNYSASRDGHQWDHLDTVVCVRAAKEIKDLRAQLADSAKPAGGPLTEFGWLIENGKKAGDGLAYRFMDNGAGGIPGWTTDPLKALRFARRADAEQFSYHDEDAWRIVEHGFHSIAAAPAPAEQHPDDTAVDAFAALMKAKMAKQRAKGYGGWETCPVERLQEMLLKHIPKGDPVDVANFAMMLSARSAATAYENQWVFDITGKWPGVASVSPGELLLEQTINAAKDKCFEHITTATKPAPAEPAAPDTTYVEGALRAMCRNYANEVRSLRAALAATNPEPASEGGDELSLLDEALIMAGVPLDEGMKSSEWFTGPVTVEWVCERWHAEVASRPLVNKNRRALDDTWRQVLRRLGVDDRARLGPTHDELLASEASHD